MEVALNNTYGIFPNRFIVNFKKWKNISEKQIETRKDAKSANIYVHILTIQIHTEVWMTHKDRLTVCNRRSTAALGVKA